MARLFASEQHNISLAKELSVTRAQMKLGVLMAALQHFQVCVGVHIGLRRAQVELVTWTIHQWHFGVYLHNKRSRGAPFKAAAHKK